MASIRRVVLPPAIRERGSLVRIRREEWKRQRGGGDRSSHAEPLLAQIEGVERIVGSLRDSSWQSKS